MSSLKKILKYFLILSALLFVLIVGIYNLVVLKPSFAIKFIDKVFLPEYSIQIESIDSNNNLLSPNFIFEKINIVDNKKNNIISLPSLRIGINLFHSLASNRLVLSILEVDSFELKGSQSDTEFKPFFLLGKKLKINNEALKVSAESYEILFSKTDTKIILVNGKVNLVPYKKIEVFVNHLSKKIYYSSKHKLNSKNLREAKLFDFSSFSEYKINLSLSSKGVFDYQNSKLIRFNKLHFDKSKLVNKSGFIIENIESKVFSDINSSLHGVFSSSIPDQQIKGSLSFNQDKDLYVRSSLFIDLTDIISSNQYFNAQGKELFEFIYKVSNGKSSMQLNTDLLRTEISSPIEYFKKDKKSSLQTSIYIADMSKPSYDLKNNLFKAFIDHKNFGYFSYGKFFDSEIILNPHNDGLYIYLDLDRINLEDFISIQSSSNGSSNLKLIKARVTEFSLFNNKYENQIFNIFFDKEFIKTEILGKNLNGTIDMDATNFIKIKLENTKFKNISLKNNSISSNLNNYNMRFIGENIRIDEDYFNSIDFYLLKNESLTTFDNIKVVSNGLNIGPNSSDEKAYISYNSEIDLYKIKGLFEIDNSKDNFDNITSYDFNFLKTDLNIQWNNLTKILNLEGRLNFLVKDLSLDRDLPNSTFLRTLSILNLNAIIESVNKTSISNNANVLRINRAEGEIYASKNRGLITSPIILETDEASMNWTGEVLKNLNGEMQDLNLDLAMRLKISENIPWYAAIFGGIPALASGIVLENIFEDTLDNVSTLNFDVYGTVEEPKLKRLN